MSIPFGHRELHNRYCFEGELELITPLRISSGRASDETDAPLMRTFNEIPYIPGSSLRGAVRSEVERIIASVGKTAGLRSCILFERTDDNCDKKARDFLSKLDNEDEKNERIAEFAEKELCDVCKLFGSPIYASRLVIEDALPANKKLDKESFKAHTRIRDGVAIDRDTGAAKDGAKFDFEVMEPGLAFRFKMVAENVATDKDRKLIDLILNLLKCGLYVGGKRTGGLGKIKLKDKKGSNEVQSKFYEVTGFENPQALWATLVGGNGEYKTIEWKEGSSC